MTAICTSLMALITAAGSSSWMRCSALRSKTTLLLWESFANPRFWPIFSETRASHCSLAQAFRFSVSSASDNRDQRFITERNRRSLQLRVHLRQFFRKVVVARCRTRRD